ncbi:MAG: ATP-binding cassette domain-containing protein [Lachnospiraceae bacterium]|nr:ATP-binding cassette domain-containing protein [Lachnospiraceae bacterium]
MKGGEGEKKEDICLDNIDFTYPGAKKPVFEKLSLRIPLSEETSKMEMGKVGKCVTGDRICIKGENGSGKSTLLSLIAGIYTPDEGKITGGDGKEFD